MNAKMKQFLLAFYSLLLSLSRWGAQLHVLISIAVGDGEGLISLSFPMIIFMSPRIFEELLSLSLSPSLRFFSHHPRSSVSARLIFTPIARSLGRLFVYLVAAACFTARDYDG